MKRVLVLIIWTLLLCSYSYAYPLLSYVPYLGGGLGYGETALSRPAIATSFTRDGFAWTAFGGYQFNPHFAVEMGDFNMQNVKASGTVSGVPINDTVKPYFVYVAAKGILPFRNGFTFFSKLGGAYAKGSESLRIANMAPNDRSQNKIVPYGAVGAGYSVSSNLSFNLVVSTTLKKGIIPRMTVGSVNMVYLIAHD